MTKIFPIDSLSNGHHIVSWPSLRGIKRTPIKRKVLSTLFGELKFARVGFCISLNKGYDVMWMESSIFLQDKDDSYNEYLVDMYEIQGIALSNIGDAFQLQEWLEKKYMWAVLSD